MAPGTVTPILRIFDEAKAREFYVEFLGFTVDWEHRFEPDLPLHASVEGRLCAASLRTSWRCLPWLGGQGRNHRTGRVS